jgi:diadenosine tetraphosphate (Ap4A) HIT family hydrolase
MRSTVTARDGLPQGRRHRDAHGRIAGVKDRFLAHLPIGERPAFPGDGMPGWEIFPYEGDIQVKVLQEPELPEPARNGAAGPADCWGCKDPLRNAVWADENWRVTHTGEPTALPVVVLLCPIGHYDLHNLPPRRSAEFGPMLQRVECAIMSLGGIARVHVNKWGDGSEHLHLWLIARPAGLMQLRGTCLPLWDDVLPPQDENQWREVLHELAAALAVEGGTAYA